MESISKALSENVSIPLRLFEVQWYYYVSAAANKFLAMFLNKTTSLEYCRIYYCYASVNGLLEISKAIESNPHLKAMKDMKLECMFDGIRYNIDGSDEARHFAHMLVTNPKMFQIIGWPSFDGSPVLFSNIGSPGAHAMPGVFDEYTLSLSTLNLYDNNIGDEGAEILAKQLGNNKVLEELNLSKNCIGDAGACALALALHHNVTSTKLILFENDKIGKVGTHQLLESLSINKAVLNLPIIGGLYLPESCKEFINTYPEDSAVNSRVHFPI